LLGGIISRIVAGPKKDRTMLSRHLAAAFAMAVSASTAQSAGWIARRGDESIYRIIELNISSGNCQRALAMLKI
jgi:uncharacterized membrane protein